MLIGVLWFYCVDGRRHCGDDSPQAEPREHGVQAGRVKHEGSDLEAVCRDACRPGFQVSMTLVASTAQSLIGSTTHKLRRLSYKSVRHVCGAGAGCSEKLLERLGITYKPDICFTLFPYLGF
jgi:hypothetical protein